MLILFFFYGHDTHLSNTIIHYSITHNYTVCFFFCYTYYLFIFLCALLCFLTLHCFPYTYLFFSFLFWLSPVLLYKVRQAPLHRPLLNFTYSTPLLIICYWFAFTHSPSWLLNEMAAACSLGLIQAVLYTYFFYTSGNYFNISLLHFNFNISLYYLFSIPFLLYFHYSWPSVYH